MASDRVNYKWHTFILKPLVSISADDINRLIDKVTRANIFGNRLDARVGQINTLNVYKQTKSPIQTRTLPNKDKEEYQIITTQYLTDDNSVKSIQYIYVEFYDPQWKIIKTVEEYPRRDDLSNAISHLMSTGSFYAIIKDKLSAQQVENYLKNNGYIAVDEEEIVVKLWKYVPPAIPVSPKDNEPSPYPVEQPTGESSGEGTYVLASGSTGLFSTGETGKINISTILLIGGAVLLLILMIRR